MGDDVGPNSQLHRGRSRRVNLQYTVERPRGDPAQYHRRRDDWADREGGELVATINDHNVASRSTMRGDLFGTEAAASVNILRLMRQGIAIASVATQL